jgi:hypothetical protein
MAMHRSIMHAVLALATSLVGCGVEHDSERSSPATASAYDTPEDFDPEAATAMEDDGGDDALGLAAKAKPAPKPKAPKPFKITFKGTTAPKAGVTISVAGFGKVARTNKKGAYQLVLSDKGVHDYSVCAAAAGYQTACQPVHGTGKARTVKLNFALQAATTPPPPPPPPPPAGGYDFSFAGLVTDALPPFPAVPGAHLVASTTDGLFHWDVTTDATGAFVLNGHSADNAPHTLQVCPSSATKPGACQSYPNWTVQPLIPSQYAIRVNL